MGSRIFYGPTDPVSFSSKSPFLHLGRGIRNDHFPIGLKKLLTFLGIKDCYGRQSTSPSVGYKVSESSLNYINLSLLNKSWVYYECI